MGNSHLGYAAGIIDGEGCIGVWGNYNNACRLKRYYRLNVTVGMSDPEPIIFLKNTFGGSYKKYLGRTPEHRSRYHWVLANDLAKSFLEDILPYLKGKREQALVAIEFQKVKKRRLYRPMTEEVMERHKWFSDRLKELKSERKEVTIEQDTGVDREGSKGW